MPPRPSLLLLTTISIPAFTLLYFRNFPLLNIKSHSISQIRSVPASLSHSSSVRKIVNPRHHAAMEDTRSVLLSNRDIRGMSDEELLARFVKGFFGGWAFWPEKCLLGAITGMGLRVGIFGAVFTSVPDNGRLIPVFSSELVRSHLPEKHTRLFGGNFLVLDSVLVAVAANSETGMTPEDEASVRGSYIDIGFGDDRKSFSGLHRFEVLRNGGDDLNADGGVRIVYSCLACNPTVKEASSFKVIHGAHMMYALMLFKDGIREILRS